MSLDHSPGHGGYKMKKISSIYSYLHYFFKVYFLKGEKTLNNYEYILVLEKIFLSFN